MRLPGFEAGGTRTGRSQRNTITPARTVPGSNVIPLTVGWAAANPAHHGSQEIRLPEVARVSWRTVVIVRRRAEDHQAVGWVRECGPVNCPQVATVGIPRSRKTGPVPGKFHHQLRHLCVSRALGSYPRARGWRSPTVIAGADHDRFHRVPSGLVARRSMARSHIRRMIALPG
jgi:hypothetical protein